MAEEFDPSLAPLPEGVLPDVHRLLKELVENQPEEAIAYLKKDPLAVVALSKILKEIKPEDSENIAKFLDLYKEILDNTFSTNHCIDDLGMALTAEMLLGYWRRLNQQIHVESNTELIIQNLIRLNDKIKNLESTTSNRVIYEIITDGLTRVQGMYTHEQKKAKQQVEPLTQLLDDFVAEQFRPLPKSGIPEVWHSLLALASMKQATASEFRKVLSKILLKHMKKHFDNLDEDQKFGIAPYLGLLEKISKS